MRGNREMKEKGVERWKSLGRKTNVLEDIHEKRTAVLRAIGQSEKILMVCGTSVSTVPKPEVSEAY